VREEAAGASGVVVAADDEVEAVLVGEVEQRFRGRVGLDHLVFEGDAGALGAVDDLVEGRPRWRRAALADWRRSASVSAGSARAVGGELGGKGQRRLSASAAPSVSVRNFAQQMSGSIGPKPAQVPKPQSVPAITRSGPTMSVN
jgi:hypothetical protein